MRTLTKRDHTSAGTISVSSIPHCRVTRSRVQTLSEKAMKASAVKRTMMDKAAACLGGVGMAEMSGVTGTAMMATVVGGTGARSETGWIERVISSSCVPYRLASPFLS